MMRPATLMDYGAANHGVTKDLIKKGGDEIGEIVRRLYSIAPKPFLPIAVAIAGSAMVHVAAELAFMGGADSGEPDPDCMLLAALLAARLGLGGEDPIAAAYADFAALKTAGRAGVTRR